MTTGSRSFNGMFSTQAWNGRKYAPMYIGTQYSKSWNGTNGNTSARRVIKGMVKKQGQPKYYYAKLPPTTLVMPPQPYTMTATTDSRGLYQVWLNENGASLLSLPVGSYVETVVVNRGNISTEDPTIYLKLADKIRKKLYGSQFAFLTFLAEGPEALAMIGAAAERIGAAIWCLKRGRWNELARALTLDPRVLKQRVNRVRGLSNKWLELSYGWLPLVQDMEAGAQYLAQANQNNTSPSRVRVSRNEEKVTNPPPWTFSSSNLTRFDREITRTSATLTVYLSRVASPYVPNIYTVAETLWEKVPYSFIGDWVMPIGSLLSALKTRADVSGKFVYSVKRTFTCDRPVANPYLSTRGLPVMGLNQYVEVHFDRTVSTELIVPPLMAFTPSLDMSWMRAANAISLLGQKDWKSLYQKWTAR